MSNWVCISLLLALRKNSLCLPPIIRRRLTAVSGDDDSLCIFSIFGFHIFITTYHLMQGPAFLSFRAILLFRLRVTPSALWLRVNQSKFCDFASDRHLELGLKIGPNRWIWHPCKFYSIYCTIVSVLRSVSVPYKLGDDWWHHYAWLCYFDGSGANDGSPSLFIFVSWSEAGVSLFAS